MQALITGLRVLLGVCVVVGSAYAADKMVVPARHFSIEVQGKYGTKWTRIYQEAGKWICQTNAIPYIEALGNPLAELDWARLQKSSGLSAGEECRDRVRVRDNRGKSPKDAQGCLTEPAFQKLVKEIGSQCRPA